MTPDFDVERDLPEQMWMVVESSVGDPGKLREQLEKLSREEFVLIFRGYVEATVEMADRLAVSGRVADASEDTLEDLAEGLVVRGREEYAAIYRGERPLPPRDEWRALPSLKSVFGDLFEERFDADIYDEIEDLG